MFANQGMNSLDRLRIPHNSDLGRLRLGSDVGEQITAMYIAHLTKQGDTIKPEEILNKSYKKGAFERIVDHKRADLLHMTLSRLAVAVANIEKLSQQQIANIRHFIWEIDSDEQAYVFLKLLQPSGKEFIILDTDLKDRMKVRIHGTK